MRNEIWRAENLLYQINEDEKTCKIIGKHATCTDRDIVIPKILDGYRVTEIMMPVYDDFGFGDKITSVVLPDSVTRIGNNAFFGCTRLANVTIPESVTSIGHSAFAGCKALTDVKLPESVSSIGYFAFDGCESLMSVVIPKAVTDISKWAFISCCSLESVFIPESVTVIGDNAFSYCKSLVSIRYDGTKKQWEKIQLGKNWNKNSSLRKVECTDGSIKI